jgi:hypothetical protein
MKDSMKYKWLASCALLFCAAIVCGTLPSPAAAQQTGDLQFVAHVAPTGGQPEPARQMTFYLLRKDLAEIRKEADQAQPPQDMDHFIDSLDSSAELKAWMKKSRIVDFTGSDFTKILKPDDILGVPEFLEAYKNLNGAILKVTLPVSEVKESDRIKNPDKYKREQDNYEKALRQYVKAHPESVDGIDAELGDANPSRRWIQLQLTQKRDSEQRVMLLAQTQYLAAKTVSDLDGRGALGGIVPGTYWISTLDLPALAGDVRLQWNVPVTIRAGQTTNIELSNLNGTPQIEHMAH